MAMTILNNTAAAMTLGELNKNVNKVGKQLARVSTGQKINGAADDASGYSISEGMRVQIRALDQDIQNTKTGSDIIAVAEGAVQSILNNLRSMKELCLNSMNDHNTDADREILNKDYAKRMELIQDIAASTDYNGKILLDGRYESPQSMKYTDPVRLPRDRGNDGSLSVPVYRRSSTHDSIEETWPYRLSNQANWPIGQGLVQNTTVANLTSSFSAMGGTTSLGSATWTRSQVNGGLPVDLRSTYSGGTQVRIDFSRAVRAEDGTNPSIEDFDQQGFSVLCGGCAQYINFQFDASLNNSQSTYDDAYDSSNSQAREYIIGIADVEVSGLEEALFSGIKAAHDNPVNGKSHLLSDAVNSLSVDRSHSLGIATDGSGNYYFTKASSPALGIYDASPSFTAVSHKERPLVIHHGTEANQSLNVYFNDMRLDALKLTGTGTVPRDYAALSLCYVEHAIEYALNEATRMGAYRSRLEMTEANLVTANENTTFAESTIRDADMAKEMTDYTKSNVLAQASQSMLAQANQNSSSVLSLLQ